MLIKSSISLGLGANLQGSKIGLGGFFGGSLAFGKKKTLGNQYWSQLFANKRAKSIIRSWSTDSCSIFHMKKVMQSEQNIIGHHLFLLLFRLIGFWDYFLLQIMGGNLWIERSLILAANK